MCFPLHINLNFTADILICFPAGAATRSKNLIQILMDAHCSKGQFLWFFPVTVASVTLTKECRLRVFENSVEGNIWIYKRGSSRRSDKCVPDIVVELLTLLLRIWEVPGQISAQRLVIVAGFLCYSLKKWHFHSAYECQVDY